MCMCVRVCVCMCVCVCVCVHVCVCMQMADAMELMILAVLSPALECEWGTSKEQEALVTTVSE